MMCALFLRAAAARARLASARQQPVSSACSTATTRSLGWALRTAGFVRGHFCRGDRAQCLALFIIVPKGFFPQQDTGRLIGALQADQSISFQAMTQKLRQMIDDRAGRIPAVEHVVGYTGVGSGGGFGQINTGSVFVSLKPLSNSGRRSIR